MCLCYAGGNPLTNTDPTGEAPWGNINQGISPTEAQALSVVRAFNDWFNTPDPCVKQQLEADHPYLAHHFTEFSALNLTVGPWNVADGGAPGYLGYDCGWQYNEVRHRERLELRTPWLGRPFRHRTEVGYSRSW